MLRLSGATSAVTHAQQMINGEPFPDSDNYWQSIREHTHSFFNDERPLWRLSLAPGHPSLGLAGDTLLDWGGAQRWLLSDESPETIRLAVDKTGGHATLFRQHDTKTEIFQPLPNGLKQLHQRLKQTFDPDGILNPGRMYSDI
jgi:glycolate oxidase FAD binding subunit